MKIFKKFFFPSILSLVTCLLLVTSNLQADSFNQYCNNGIDDSTQGGSGLSSGEHCEDYNANDNDDCRSDCQLAGCGDGVLYTTHSDTDPNNSIPDLKIFKGELGGFESCDDGNTENGDGCSDSCGLEALCRNGTVEAGEECDDGNNVNDDTCRNNCKAPKCGDGILDVGETCDDGASDGPGLRSNDGCSNTCQDENEASTVVCGDGIAEGAEACDDLNVNDGDGCSADCSTVEFCGNNVIELGLQEECDDANTDNTDTCLNSCQGANSCGNLVVESPEVCDDGNTQDGDGCSADCATIEEPSLCGNGIKDEGEACDDGNQNSQDLCKDNCLLNTVAAESGIVCGDGKLTAPESCDDGNIADGDGCSNSCVDEDGTTDCGNCIPEAGECSDAGLGLTGSCDTDCQDNCTVGGADDGSDGATDGSTEGSDDGDPNVNPNGAAGGCALSQTTSSSSMMASGFIFALLGILAIIRKQFN